MQDKYQESGKSIDERLELVLRNTDDGDPIEKINRLFSPQGIEEIKKHIGVPDALIIKRPKQKQETNIDKNFFNLMRRLETQQVMLAGRFNELMRMEDSEVYSTYVKARDYVKRSLGIEVETYDGKTVLNKQLENLKAYNNAMSDVARYSDEVLTALRSKNIERLLEMGMSHELIVRTNEEKNNIKELLEEARGQIPKNPWGEEDMIRIALAKGVEYIYNDKRHELDLQKDALMETLSESKFIDSLERVVEISTHYFRKLLEKGFHTSRVIENTKPSLEIISNQGKISRIHEGQIRDIGESSLKLYEESGIAYGDIFNMIQEPVFDSYKGYMKGSLRNYIGEEKGISLDEIDPLSKISENND